MVWRGCLMGGYPRPCPATQFDEKTKMCWVQGTAPEDRVLASGDGNAAPIIGGSGKFKYQYMPDLLKMEGASLVNCHGLVTDKDKNIYLTYQNDGKDKNCLIKWKPDGTGGEFMTGPAGSNVSVLCAGTPHGLKIKTENGEEVLYHANNNQKLTKTKLDGTVIWQKEGLFGQDTTVYRPTWHAVPPGSDYTYLCDGALCAFACVGGFMGIPPPPPQVCGPPGQGAAAGC
jgi:hypothetical protein